MLWDARESFVYAHRPPDDAIAEAASLDDGPIILLDHADNCGSGATQDVMTVIEAVLSAELEDVIVAAVWDPAAVAQMARAVGLSHTSVQRIWKAHGLKPHLTK